MSDLLLGAVGGLVCYAIGYWSGFRSGVWRERGRAMNYFDAIAEHQPQDAEYLDALRRAREVLETLPG